MTDPALEAIVGAWRIAEETLVEAGVTGPASPDSPCKTRAEQIAKAIFARMAGNDPCILPCLVSEMKDG